MSSDDSDMDESPTPVSKKSNRPARPERKGSERHERPRAHRSRNWNYSEGARTPTTIRSKSRSKSRTRPPPKTMKEMMDRRQKQPSQTNRYKASNFESIKKTLLKDSAALDKSIKGKMDKNKANQARKDAIDLVAESNDSSRDPKPDQDDTTANEPTKPTFITSVTTSTSETTHERVITNPADGKISKASFGTKGPADYLDHTETQMGIVTAREQHDDQVIRKETPPTPIKQAMPVKKSPERKPAKETETLDAEVASLTSQQKQKKDGSQIPENRRESQVPRAQSRVSAEINRKPPSDAQSEARVSRAPSRASIMSKQQNVRSTDTQGSRAPSRNTNQGMYEKYENKTAIRRNSVISQQSVYARTTQNGRLSRASIMKPTNEQTPAQNSTGRLSRTSNIASTKGSISSVYKPVENNKRVDRSPHLTNGDINTANSKSPESQRSQKHTSPVVNGHSRTPRESPKREPAEPVIKRNVQVSDVVNEVVMKKTNRKPAAGKASKSKEGRPRASKHRVIRARSPAGRGHEDSRISVDEYERKAQSRPARTRNRSGSRGRGRSSSKTRRRSGSRSRERKRSVSRDRKGAQPKQKSYSRFPEIDKSGRLSSLSNGEGKSKRKVSVNVREDVTEKIVTPVEREPKQWKDLVSKYLRQPSPKVGKTDDRALLEANLSTDEDDDEIDIFERAKKRYLLDSDDDDI